MFFSSSSLNCEVLYRLPVSLLIDDALCLCTLSPSREFPKPHISFESARTFLAEGVARDNSLHVVIRAYICPFLVRGQLSSGCLLPLLPLSFLQGSSSTVCAALVTKELQLLPATCIWLRVCTSVNRRRFTHVYDICLTW